MRGREEGREGGKVEWEGIGGWEGERGGEKSELKGEKGGEKRKEVGGKGEV